MSKLMKSFVAAFALLVVLGGVAKAAECCGGQCCNQPHQECCHKK